MPSRRWWKRCRRGDEDVARASYDLIRESQSRLNTASDSEQVRFHSALIDSIAQISTVLPDDRTGWATTLLQSTLVSIADQPDGDSERLYKNATDAMELLTLSRRAGPSILSDQPLDPDTPRRLNVLPQKLPVEITSCGRSVDGLAAERNFD